MKKADRVFPGFSPSLEYADNVYYITRGRKPSEQCPPLTREEWLKVVKSETEIILDELYYQLNIDKGWDIEELWQELGRARWDGAPGGEPEWFHYSEANIDYIHDYKFKGGKHHDRYQKIRRELDNNPTLEAWRDYVCNDPWMQLEEEIDPFEPGRALWLNKKGEVKHLYRYMPSSVWMYIDPTLESAPSEPSLQRLELCKRIARSLSCEVWHGRNEVIHYGG